MEDFFGLFVCGGHRLIDKKSMSDDLSNDCQVLNVKMVSANERAFFRLQNFIKLRKKNKFRFNGKEQERQVTIQSLIIQIYPPTLFLLSTKKQKFIVFIKTTRSEKKMKHDNGTRHVVVGC